MKIGIYGGSFNPVHRAHIASAAMLLEQGYLDRIYMVPTHRNALEPGKELISGHHRLAMLALATKDQPNILVSDYDLRNANVHSYQTITFFQERKSPGDKLYFMLGADAFNSFLAWKGQIYIVNHTTLLVFVRDGVTINPAVGDDVKAAGGHLMVAAPLYTGESNMPRRVSSTIIRKLLQSEKETNFDNLLPYFPNPDVLKYIIKHNLYNETIDDRMVFIV